jgi:hypothetical protein
MYVVFMPETHRQIVDDGSIVPHQWWRQSVVQWLDARRRLKRMSAEERKEHERTRQALMERQQHAAKIRFPNPLQSFVILTNPDAFCIVMYTGVMMFCNLVLMTSTPTVFPGLYGLDELQVGLCFL